MKQDVEMMMGMMRSIIQGFIRDSVKAEPESESVREQANVLAINIAKIPIVKETLAGIIDGKTLARIFYNMKQTDFDELYHIIETAKKFRR